MKEPKFERRHMKMIAAVLRETAPVRPPIDIGDHISNARWGIIKVRMGDMLAKSNPRFNRGKFEEACEP
jgi:hypothetical protein